MEDNLERGISCPLMKEDEVEDANECGVKGLLCENVELLLAREDEAIDSVHKICC